MVAFLKLVRYKNLLMVLLTLILTKYALIDSFGFTFSNDLSNFEFALLTVGILCITASGYIINDIYDIETDIINKPSMVYIDKTIQSRNAWTIYWVLNSIGILISIIWLQIAFFYFLIVISLLLIYSRYLKRKVLIGNLIVSLLVSLTIFIVYYAKGINVCGNIDDFISYHLNQQTNHILTYCLFSFVITFIREIIKDIEDIKGDYATNMKTLPILIGIKRTNTMVLLISSAFFVYILFILKQQYSFQILFWYGIVFIIIPFALFIYKLRMAKTTQHYHQLSQLLKIIMLFGILSMLLFKFQ